MGDEAVGFGLVLYAIRIRILQLPALNDVQP
jgi:hypothetical protein